MSELAKQLERVFVLLKKTQPIADPTDVIWWGPCFIPRPGEWYPSSFTLYNGALYARLFVAPGSYGLSWKIGSKTVEFEREFSSGRYYNNDELWEKALNQIEYRLKSAIKNFGRYNQFVEKNFPLVCRTGKIRRELTWPKKTKRPVSLRKPRLLEKSLNEAKEFPLLQKMTLSQYLETVAIAYDASFKELRLLPPLEKYKKKAERLSK